MNKILSKNQMEVYVGSDELKKINKSFFKNNKIYLVFFVATATSKITASKITKQGDLLKISATIKSALDESVTTDCLVIGVKKNFANNVKKIRMVFKY